MKFALINGSKIEATKGAKGVCPSCGSELIAKCGEFKINHWAHKGVHNCDPWWENETEWHRLWKNNFPVAWQETPLLDQLTGEKHIADVKTEHGVVIEFQHSPINAQERMAREKFYMNMIWIVDGARLKKDYPRFCKGRNDLRATQKKGLFIIDFPDECFPSSWLASSVPVIFDFRGVASIDDPGDIRHGLYCLFPRHSSGHFFLAAIPRTSLIVNLLNGNFPIKLASTDSVKQIEVMKPSGSFRRRESPYYLERGRWKRRRHL
ncbi:competence protein [Fulvivirgaceae bacterium PWU4]|uniref:Competence protein n=1 Tax=Chryseosolibacter histidini TaxID=2782349 RepID=A0AAP2GLK9_9BACT|nr:competence protein CoiA family protein [Chryseosolibacter histidini]MBT1695918.1 competence protein [Chryseosolibacter histidini]